MSKKKSVKKSTKEKIQDNNTMADVDLSSLIDAAKSSFLEFNDSEKPALGAERARVFEHDDVAEVKAAVHQFNEEFGEKTEAETKLETEAATHGGAEEKIITEITITEGSSLSVSEEENSSTCSELLEAVSFKCKELDFVEEEIADGKAALLVEAQDSAAIDAKEEFSENFDPVENKEFSIAQSEEEDLFGIEEGLFGSTSAGSDPADDQKEDLIAGSELEGFDAAPIEELEFLEEPRLESIIESVLFATDRPISIPSLKQIFKGTNVTNARLKKALETLQVEYAGSHRGVTLEEVGSGFQLRTKVDNMEFLRRSFKAKSFKLSGPALEVLAITAYKQPIVKAEIDEIRGVESGHLLRALMEKNLVLFAGKSDLPGKPMQYATTRKFLEIFGLRNLKELPTLSQIDELLPDGIGDEEEKPQLADIADGLAEKTGQSYSEGEEELLKISDQLEKIDTSSEFFEKEKLRQKQERDAEKARNIQDAIAVGEEVSTRDRNWLKKYEEQLLQPESQANGVIATVDSEKTHHSRELASEETALEAWDLLEEASHTDESEHDQNDLAQRLEANDIAHIDEEI